MLLMSTKYVRRHLLVSAKHAVLRLFRQLQHLRATQSRTRVAHDLARLRGRAHVG